MILQRQIISGWVDEQTSGSPQYRLQDSLDAGFQDITSIENIHAHWYKCSGIDFRKARQEISLLIDDAGGFSALTTEQKNIACIFKLGTHSERVGFLGTTVHTAYMKAYNYNTSICREARLFETEIIVRNELPDNHKDILGDARTAILDYKFFGVEGTQNADLEGILDYIWGTTGTSYAGVGLLQKAWTPETMTLNDLCSKLNDIIANGEYFFTMPPGYNWVLI